MNTRAVALIFLSPIIFISPRIACAQQFGDPEFNTRVEHPAYSKNLPRVLFDETHNNLYTAIAGYKAFADVISNDGYHLVRNRKPFIKESLNTFKVLVIANALGAEDVDDEGADHPAFPEEEADIVRDWVRGGGSLLLLADPAPFGSAAESLARRFGVEMSKGLTRDPANHDKNSSEESYLVYSRANNLLLDHPITQGRGDAEKINRVIAFSGQSLKGPNGSATFLKLSDTAVDLISGKDVSAAGRAEGIALKFGKGRVVVLGEAVMLSAQLAGSEKRPIGMNYAEVDNKQLALNIMHWLSGLLKDR